MASRPSFIGEISNLLHAKEGSPINRCIQCGTCSSTCPVAEFMEHSPREIIALIRAGQKSKVLSSNTYWYCASCYQCTVRCPEHIDIADMMYALKRYSIWKGRFKRGLIGPGFSTRFARIVIQTGKSYEPALAPSYIFKGGIRALFNEMRIALALFMRRRIPVLPPRIKRVENFRKMIGRIIPLGAVK